MEGSRKVVVLLIVLVLILVCALIYTVSCLNKVCEVPFVVPEGIENKTVTEKVETENVEIPAEVKELAEQRLQAKTEKNYALADELRNKITEMWFTIKDIPGGYEIMKN